MYYRASVCFVVAPLRRYYYISARLPSSSASDFVRLCITTWLNRVASLLRPSMNCASRRDDQRLAAHCSGVDAVSFPCESQHGVSTRPPRIPAGSLQAMNACIEVESSGWEAPERSVHGGVDCMRGGEVGIRGSPCGSSSNPAPHVP